MNCRLALITPLMTDEALTPDDAEAAELTRRRESWQHRGASRPRFAQSPAPHQESVWDYPRPPRIEVTRKRLEIRLAGELVAATKRALRVLETAHAPTYYLPKQDIVPEALRVAQGSSFCEWKGPARYFDVVAGSQTARRAAWTYPAPLEGASALLDHVAFYAHLVDCFVDGEQARSQAGGFYGGWITSDLAGPIKGEPGSSAW